MFLIIAISTANKANEEDTATQGSIDWLPIAGDLSIAVADYSDSIKSAPAKGTVVFNAVDFKASEKITIESVKLERTGLSDKSAIKWVWFEKDGVAVSAKASLTSDGTATTRFYNNFSVNGTEKLDLVVELSGAAGSEIAFNIIWATSTAKNVSVNTKTTTYRTTLYTVATINFQKNGSVTEAGTTYKLGEKNSYEIGRFAISNETKGTEDKDIVLKSLKLKNNGGLDMAAVFKNVIVTRDSKTVSKNVELSSKDMVITFDNDELASGKKGIYTIFAEVANLDRPGEDVQLYLNKTSELVAYEKSSNFRVAYHSDMDTSSNLMSQKYIFNGGKINFAGASNFAKTIEAAASSTDVEIARGTLTVAEPIKLEGLVITGTKLGAKNPIKTLKVEIGGSTYTANDPADDDHPVWKFTDEMYVSKTSDVRVLVSVKSDATADHSITFTSINWQAFGKVTFENSDKTYTITGASDQIAGTVQLSKLVATPGKFFITNKATSTQKVVLTNNDEVTIFDGEITTNKDKISVNDLTLTGNYTYNYYSTGDDATKYATAAECKAANKDADCPAVKKANGLQTAEQISLTVYVNGEAYSDSVFRQTSAADSSVKFSNLWDVTSSNPMRIKITAQPLINKFTGSITFKVGAEGTDSQGNNAKASAASAVTLSITESASINIANSVATSTVEKAGATSELVRFTSTVKNGSLTLSSMVINLTWDDAANAIFVAGDNAKEVYAEFDGKRIDGKVTTRVANNTWVITFANLNETLEAGTHEFVVKTDINADNGPVKLTIGSVSVNGITPATQLNVAKMFGKAYPKLSLVKSDSTNNEITIKIENPKDSDEDLTIEKITVSEAWSIATISLNNQTINPTWNENTATLDKTVTLSAGQSTELRLQVKNPEGADPAISGIAQLKWVGVRIDSNPYSITDDYTNVATWADLKITYKK